MGCTRAQARTPRPLQPGLPSWGRGTGSPPSPAVGWRAEALGGDAHTTLVLQVVQLTPACGGGQTLGRERDPSEAWTLSIEPVTLLTYNQDSESESAVPYTNGRSARAWWVCTGLRGAVGTAAGQGRPRKAGRQAEPRASKTAPALPRRTAVRTIPPLTVSQRGHLRRERETMAQCQPGRGSSRGPQPGVGLRLPSDPMSLSCCPCVPCASFSKLFSGWSRQALGKVLGALGAQHGPVPRSGGSEVPPGERARRVAYSLCQGRSEIWSKWRGPGGSCRTGTRGPVSRARFCARWRRPPWGQCPRLCSPFVLMLTCDSRLWPLPRISGSSAVAATVETRSFVLPSTCTSVSVLPRERPPAAREGQTPLPGPGTRVST